MAELLIFTDLDGTLLDHHTYSFAPALKALDLIQKLEIPLIICSSKTRIEVVKWQSKLKIFHPFITENGGGIFIPSNYSLPPYPGEISQDTFRVVVLGIPWQQIYASFQVLKKKYRLRGLSEMSPGEVAAVTGLEEQEAQDAQHRDFSEPFFFQDREQKWGQLIEEVSRLGLQITRGGRFFHLIGPGTDKGKAVKILTALYKKKQPHLKTMGLGDSANDLPMLQAVDVPVLVQGPSGKHDPRLYFPGLYLAQGTGPRGWNEAVLKLVKEMARTGGSP